MNKTRISIILIIVGALLAIGGYSEYNSDSNKLHTASGNTLPNGAISTNGLVFLLIGIILAVIGVIILIKEKKN